MITLILTNNKYNSNFRLFKRIKINELIKRFTFSPSGVVPGRGFPPSQGKIPSSINSQCPHDINELPTNPYLPAEHDSYDDITTSPSPHYIVHKEDFPISDICKESNPDLETKKALQIAQDHLALRDTKKDLEDIPESFKKLDNTPEQQEHIHNRLRKSVLEDYNTSINPERYPQQLVFQPLDEKAVIQESLDKGLITYGAAGKAGDNGSLQLTKTGHELNRVISGDMQKPAYQTEDTPEITLTLEIQNNPKYSAVVLEVHEDTIILTSEQKHMVIVEGDPSGNETVKGFMYLTSASGTKIGISGMVGPQNPLLSETKPSGQHQPQYCVPIIPPLVISTDKCLHLSELDDYIQQPSIITILDGVQEQTAKYEPIPYKTPGISIEKLHEMNVLNDHLLEINENVCLSKLKLEINDEIPSNEEVD